MIKRVKRWIRKEKAIKAALILWDYCNAHAYGCCNRCPLSNCCNELFAHGLQYYSEAILTELDK